MTSNDAAIDDGEMHTGGQIQESGSPARGEEDLSGVNEGVGSQATPRIQGSVQVGRNRLLICRICSNKNILGYKTKEIRHEHFSSKYFMECEMSKSEKSGSIFCPTCKKPHSDFDQQRVKICISSSSLHEFWAQGESGESYEGDCVHIEYITIPNARINELTVAFEIQYLEDPRPMDVILVAGIENLVKGYQKDSLMKAYKHLVDLVKWQEEKFHPDVENSCGIATLYYPPQVCNFDRNELSSQSRNQLQTICELNNDIEGLNAKSGLKVPNFKRFGVRKSTKGKRATKHRWEHWVGDQPATMLHLRRDQRMKMGRQVGKYFKYET